MCVCVCNELFKNTDTSALRIQQEVFNERSERTLNGTKEKEKQEDGGEDRPFTV